MLRTFLRNGITGIPGILLFVLSFVLPAAGFAQCPTIPTAAGTYTVTYNNPAASCNFTVPAGVTSITIEAWGGGGGGGGARTSCNPCTQTAAGGGGKGGMYAKETVSVSEGTVVAIAVGAGGSAGSGSASSATAGGAGGSSTATISSVVVTRGAGGNGGSAANGSGAAAGATLYAATGIGSTIYNGGNGASGARTTSRQSGGGGGGGAGTGADGASATNPTNSGGTPNGVSAGGAGGATGGGAGGNGGSNTSTGTTAGSGGSAIGGGGGGARAYTTGSNVGAGGGAGARGEVRITYTVVSNTYIAQYNSMSYGTSSWCAGETRNVTVSVTNTGTVTWTNPAIRFSYKWDADAWFDNYGAEYFSSDVAPGATVSKTFSITAPMTSGTNHLSFNLVREGVCWFPDCHASNSIYVSPDITITSPSSSGLSSGDWLFTGAVSAIYENPSNWLKWNGSSFQAIGVYSGQSVASPPQITDNVRIKPAGTCIFNQPVVSNSADFGFTAPASVTANANNIVIEAGATLSFHASNNPHFHVASVFTNNGSIVTGTGRLKFIGTGIQSLSSSNATETFYELNIGANSVTTFNTNVTVTNLINLNGVISTGSNVLYLSNSSAASLASSGGQVSGLFRRAIANNTSEYVFPMATGTTLNTDRRQLSFINGNIAGVSYLTCGVSNTFKGSGSNTDANLDPAKAKHYAQTFNVVRPEAEWTLTPNTAPSGGTYGVKLYLRNFGSLTDNTFSVLKRPDASVSFFDFDSYYTSAPIPGPDLAGRVYDGGNGYAQKSGLSSFSKFVVATASSPLPVKLKNFTARCENDEVHLQWVTGSEMNSYQFTVQSSRDLQVWTDVAELPAAGNSSVELHYEAVDKDPAGDISYYRLLQSDYDGKQEIFGPLSVYCEGTGKGMMIFPNPARGSFFVEIFSGIDQEDAVIRIFNAQGQLMYQHAEDLKAGTNSIPVSFDAGAGIYTLRLAGREDYSPVRLVIY